MEPEIKSNAVYTTKEVQDYLKVIKANKVGNQYRVLGREILNLISPEVEKKASDIYQKIKQKTKDTIKNW